MKTTFVPSSGWDEIYQGVSSVEEDDIEQLLKNASSISEVILTITEGRLNQEIALACFLSIARLIDAPGWKEHLDGISILQEHGTLSSTTYSLRENKISKRKR